MEDRILKYWNLTKAWLFILTVLLIIALFPRMETLGSGNSDCQCITTNISTTITNIVENKSLGQTLSRQPIEAEIMRTLPKSLKLIIPAFILSLLLGVVKGIFDFRNARKRLNFLGNGATWLFQAIPDFFLVLCIQYIAFLLLINDIVKLPIYGSSNWYNVLIPTLLLSIYPTMYIARITSAALHSQDGMKYLQTAKAKGLSDNVVIYKHALANCWETILSHFSSVMLYIISNLFIVEYLMFYQGAAYRLYTSMGIHIRPEDSFKVFDGPLVFGFILAFLLIIFITNLLGKMLKKILVPQIKEDL